MNVNSFTMLSKKATKYTIAHLQAAENGRTAPGPVVEIENDLASAIGNRIKGDIHTLTAPGRAFAGLFV